jgi:hypothetical protein
MQIMAIVRETFRTIKRCLMLQEAGWRVDSKGNWVDYSGDLKPRTFCEALFTQLRREEYRAQYERKQWKNELLRN